MSVDNFLPYLQGALKAKVLTKTAMATLTNDEVMRNFRIRGSHASAAIALTFPAASAANDGAILIVENTNAAVVTAVVTEGFGNGGNDTLTLAEGEAALVYSAETDTVGTFAWYGIHNEPAA